MTRHVGAYLLGVLLFAGSAQAQQQPTPAPAPQASNQAVGTIVTLRPTTLILRTDDGRYLVFEFDRQTLRPKALAAGKHVTVEYVPTEDPDEPRIARAITLTEPQPGAQAAVSEEAVPPKVRRLEQQVAATVRRFRAGFRAGVALDPELVSLGAHATFGPIFSRRLQFRPNIEFAYGELTTLIAVNLEGVYRLTETLPRNRWSPYVGGGLTLGFGHQGLTVEEEVDFDDLSFDGGLNVLGGVEKGSGIFVELKATLYTDPHLRLLVGFTF